MSINSEDGQYGLDIWEDRRGEGDPDDCEYSDNIDCLRDRAKTLINGGRFKYVELSHWDADIDDWDVLETFKAPLSKRRTR